MSSEEDLEIPADAVPDIPEEKRCPDCGSLPETTTVVNLGDLSFHYRCECGRSYTEDAERDSCVFCEKPLGSRDILCFSCEREVEE